MMSYTLEEYKEPKAVKKLIRWSKKQKWTPKELALALGVSRDTVFGWVGYLDKYPALPSLKNAVKVYNLTGIRPEEWV